jgi:hypothetical protein
MAQKVTDPSTIQNLAKKTILQVDQEIEDVRRMISELNIDLEFYSEEASKDYREIKRLSKKLNKFSIRRTVCSYTGLLYINNINEYLNRKITTTQTQLALNMDYIQLSKDMAIDVNLQKLACYEYMNELKSKKHKLNFYVSKLKQKQNQKLYV